jgi:hypothetical protein
MFYDMVSYHWFSNAGSPNPDFIETPLDRLLLFPSITKSRKFATEPVVAVLKALMVTGLDFFYS